MKLHVNFCLLMFMTITYSSYGQDLTLSNGQSIHINNSTVLFVNGLEFDSNLDFEITAPNSISRSSVPINAQSINRVFNFDNAVNNFQGDLTLYYEDSELNGIDENNLVLNLEDELNQWMTYSSTLDTNANFMSYNFSTPINILSATASEDAGLSINEPFTTHLKVYPNPTTHSVYIETPIEIEVRAYNGIGQQVLTTSKKVIDVSHLSSGLYVFEVKSSASNQKKSFKVLKY